MIEKICSILRIESTQMNDMRVSVCFYCGKKEFSSLHLNCFSSLRSSNIDMHYCGCIGDDNEII